MKCTGLLMTPENYDKVASGVKVQTRRIVEGKALDIINDLAGSPDPSPLTFQYVKDCERPDDDGGLPYLYTGLLVSLEEYPEEGFIELPCRFGTVGDRLYVKEGLQNVGGSILYRRDHHPVRLPSNNTDWPWKRPSLSPLHMPKWAARLWLELLEVRVERVQEISEDDAMAEGCLLDQCESEIGITAVFRFSQLWESIHGHGSWERNDWVWHL